MPKKSNSSQFLLTRGYDTPERLTEFTDLHGVEWPHLTGDSDLLADVYNSFGVIVQEEVIQAHIANSEPTVTFVDASGNSSEMMFEPTGWTLNEIIAEEANWTINATYGQYGHFVQSINGVESPADWSWYWALHTFNSSSMAWEESMVGIDDIDALENEHLAWAASNANTSGLSLPQMNDSNASIQILYPDNTTENHSLQTDFNAYHLTKGAFAGAGLNASFSNDPTYGHFVEALDDVNSPSDWSWYWSMYVWNTSSTGWESSMLGSMIWLNQATSLGHQTAPIFLKSRCLNPFNQKTKWLLLSATAMVGKWVQVTGNTACVMRAMNGAKMTVCLVLATERSTLIFQSAIQRLPTSWMG